MEARDKLFTEEGIQSKAGKEPFVSARDLTGKGEIICRELMVWVTYCCGMPTA